MPLAKVVCFPSMIAAVLTEIRLFHGNSTKSIHIEKHPSPIGSEFLELNKLHKIGITSEDYLKLSYCVAITRSHFVVTEKGKSEEIGGIF